MRSKLLNITSRLLGVLIVIAVTIVNSSCSDTETTDSTKFTIYYTGMTDIGPSMTGVISSPTYKGGTPYDLPLPESLLMENRFPIASSPLIRKQEKLL